MIMKKVPLGIVDRNQCERALQRERLGDKFRLDGSFICAGGVEGVDTCQVNRLVELVLLQYMEQVVIMLNSIIENRAMVEHLWFARSDDQATIDLPRMESLLSLIHI